MNSSGPPGRPKWRRIRTARGRRTGQGVVDLEDHTLRAELALGALVVVANHGEGTKDVFGVVTLNAV